MSTPNPKCEQTRLERLAALLRDDNVDAESMTSPQLAQYLKDNKVEMAGPQKRFAAILKKAKARRRLELARANRLQAGEKAHQFLSAGSAALEAIRERVRAKIAQFGKNNPGEAAVYAREFEKATPEDLQSMEEDLMILEMEQPEDGARDKQDQG